MGAILVISRTVAPVKDFFVSIGVSFSNILGEAGVSAGVQPLYLPGGILVLVVIATFFIHRMSTRAMGEALKESGGVLLSAGCVLLFTVPMVRIVISSGFTLAERASMPLALAASVADCAGGSYPFLASTGGAVGA